MLAFDARSATVALRPRLAAIVTTVTLQPIQRVPNAIAVAKIVNRLERYINDKLESMLIVCSL